MNVIYVIFIDGEPYRKDSAIRTYKTRERAVKEVRGMIALDVKYPHRGVSKYEVSEFTAINTEEVSAE